MNKKFIIPALIALFSIASSCRQDNKTNNLTADWQTIAANLENTEIDNKKTYSFGSTVQCGSITKELNGFRLSRVASFENNEAGKLDFIAMSYKVVSSSGELSPTFYELELEALNMDPAEAAATIDAYCDGKGSPDGAHIDKILSSPDL